MLATAKDTAENIFTLLLCPLADGFLITRIRHGRYLMRLMYLKVWLSIPFPFVAYEA